MSAGLGDLIVAISKRENLLLDNVFIISNLFEFDSDGKAIRLANKVIHSSNKHEVEIQEKPFYKEVMKRKNIILLGDKEEYIGMTAGHSYDKYP